MASDRIEAMGAKFLSAANSVQVGMDGQKVLLEKLSN